MSETKPHRRTASEWERLIEAFLTSGLTQTAFCQQQGISFHTFRHRYQHSRLFRGRRRDPAAVGDFQPITLCPPLAVAAGWRIHFGEHVRIDCPRDTAVDAIVQLARGLAHDA